MEKDSDLRNTVQAMLDPDVPPKNKSWYWVWCMYRPARLPQQFKKWIAVFLILYLIALLLTIGFILLQFLQTHQSKRTPTNFTAPATNRDPTANWKTYTDNKYRFSFKYPSSLFAKIDSDGKSTLFFETSKSKETFRFGLYIGDNPENLDLQVLTEKTKPIPYDRINKYEKYQVNLNDALIIRSELPCVGFCENRTIDDQDYRVVIKGNKVVVSFHVVTYRYGAESVVSEEWLNQILSTFKFTQ